MASKAVTAKEIVAAFAELGVLCYIACSGARNRWVWTLWLDMFRAEQAAGRSLPPRINFLENRDQGAVASFNPARTYKRADGTTFETEASISVYRRTSRWTGELHLDGQTVMPTPEGTVLHELAHWWHWENGGMSLCPRQYVWQRTNGAVEVAARVSAYATVDALEFIAETYVALRHGLVTDSGVLAQYAMYMGPEQELAQIARDNSLTCYTA